MKKFTLSTLFVVYCSALICQVTVDSLFEDIQFNDGGKTFFKSEKVDFFRIPSTVTDGVEFAVVVYKPVKPSPVLLLSHGWHMSVAPPSSPESPYPDFLTVQVDMRGRKYSTGDPDCNGWELYDFYDAYLYLLAHYQAYISDPAQVYYMGGSGGGGNGFALIGKFPDLFCSASIACGISDYALWYEQDSVIGEFRDEMDVWIGGAPEQNAEAYRSRSGITTVKNIITPAYISHGETDIRVPASHSRTFVEKARKLGKNVHYLELKNVGNRDHWGKITPEQNAQRQTFERSALNYHPEPQLPPKGKLIVAGYIVTKHFMATMRSIDQVGIIRYDLKKQKITFVEGSGDWVWKSCRNKSFTEAARL